MRYRILNENLIGFLIKGQLDNKKVYLVNNLKWCYKTRIKLVG